MSAAVGMLVLLSANPLGFNTEANVVTAANTAELTSFEWQYISSPQYAGEPISVRILAKDEDGDSLPWNGVAFLTTTRDSYIYPEIVQFSAGVCDTNVIVTIADSLALQCEAGSASGTSNVFEVLPGAADRLVVILPGERLTPGVAGGRAGRPDDHSAGDTFSFLVYLTDSCFNQIEARDDSVFFSSTDGFAQLPAGGVLSDGVGSFAASLRTAGQRRIISRPADASLSADTSSAARINAGPFTQMLLVAPGEDLLPGDTATSAWQTPGKTGTPDPQYLLTPFSVTVYPCDRCWNRVTGTGDTVFLHSDFPFEFLPAAVELGDAAVFDQVRFSTAGSNQSIWAVNQANGDKSYATRLNIRALGVTLEITAPDTTRSGETTEVLIRVLDANGDPIVATLVKDSVVMGSGRMLEPALLTDTLGYATAYFLCMPSPASEQDSIRISTSAADTVIGIYVKHLSDSLFAYPNPFGSVNSPTTQIFYSLQRSSSVKVMIYDQFGNKVRTVPGATGRAGDNTVSWDGRNDKGHRVASGIYLIQVLGTLNTGIDFRSMYRIGVVW